jgi:hypothetical protein
MALIKTRREFSVTRLCFAAASIGFSFAALASPPLNTDDAGTLDPGNCQFEIERRRFNRLTELDIVPTCNLFADMELAIGGLRANADGEARVDGVMFSIKKVLMAGGDSGWSAGFNASTIRASGNSFSTRQNQVTALFTRPLDADTNTAVHLNAGWIHDREAGNEARRDRFTWAVAVESDVSARWTVVAEVFGQQGLPEAAQVGLRWWAVPGHVQFTTSIGTLRGLGQDGRWTSFGVRFETARSIF